MEQIQQSSIQRTPSAIDQSNDLVSEWPSCFLVYLFAHVLGYLIVNIDLFDCLGQFEVGHFQFGQHDRTVLSPLSIYHGQFSGSRLILAKIV